MKAMCTMVFITLYTNQEKDSPSEITGSYEFHTFKLCKVPQLLALVKNLKEILTFHRKSDEFNERLCFLSRPSS